MSGAPRNVKKPQTPEQLEIHRKIKKAEQLREQQRKAAFTLETSRGKQKYLTRFQQESLRRMHERLVKYDEEIRDLWKEWHKAGKKV